VGGSNFPLIDGTPDPWGKIARFEGPDCFYGYTIVPDSYDTNAVVYCLPGTTGWGPTFSDLPTVLWNPQV
jgi:hypothetical protein